MSIVKSKGTAVLQEVSSVYTAIPQISSIKLSEYGGRSFEAPYLDQSTATIARPGTGFSDATDISFDIWYDPAHARHAGLKTLARTPADTNFKVTRVDSGPLSEIYVVTAVRLSEDYGVTEGAKASVTLTTSGAPS